MFRLLKRWIKPSDANSVETHQTALSLPAKTAQRVARLNRFIIPGEQEVATQSLLVFDVETTGLDLGKDQMLSVGAVCINQMSIVLHSTMERVFNINVKLPSEGQLFHGLTQDDLQQGVDPRDGLLDLLELGEDSIWLAWNGWFDQHMLHKAANQWLGLLPPKLPTVFDLALLVPALFPQYKQHGATLDDWLRRVGIDISMRHNAAADAMATAQLALVCLHHAQKRGHKTWADLTAIAKKEHHAREQENQTLWHGF